MSFANTAGKLNELAHGDSEGGLELARVLHVARDREQTVSLGLFCSHRGVPLRGVLENSRHLADRLNVINNGRASIQTRNSREWGLETRVTAEAFQGIQKSGFFTTDVCAGTRVSGNAKIAQQTGLGCFLYRIHQATVNVNDLAAQVDKCVVAIDGPRGNRNALNQHVRVRHNRRDILTGSRFRFIGVNHQVTRKTVIGRKEGPLQASGESSATTASQARGLNGLNDLGGLHGIGLLESLVAASAQVRLQSPRAIASPAAGQNRGQCHGCFTHRPSPFLLPREHRPERSSRVLRRSSVPVSRPGLRWVLRVRDRRGSQQGRARFP